MRIGADPLGGASVDYWAEIATRHGLDLTVVNPLVDATWRFMTLDWDGKIRMDCSSPSAMASLVAAEGQVRDRDRQRRRLRPARHRHAGRRADEPQPLPRRRDPVPLRRRPPGLAVRRRRSARPWSRSSMIDRVAAAARHADGRGAGRVQVVRAGADRRVVRLRRRGVRRCVVPAHGRHHVDHRQGRADPRPARLGDPREDRQVAAASTTPTWSPSTATRRTPASTRPPPASRRPSSRALSPDDVTATELAGEPITAKLHRGARQPRQDRRPQGHHRVRLVRRPPLGHRGRLQDLRRVVQGPRAPRRGAGRGEGRRGRRPVGVVVAQRWSGRSARRDRSRRHGARERSSPARPGPASSTLPLDARARHRAAPRPPR